MDVIIPAFHHQLGKECTESLFKEHINSYCFSLFLSKLVGILILLLSVIAKLPQIFKVIKNNSSKGINLTSILIETGALSIITAYCFKNLQPFTTFGDAVFILIQNILLVTSIYLVNKQSQQLLTFLIINVVANYLFYYILSNEHILYLMLLLIPLSILGVFPQLIENYKSKSIGQLAPLTIYIGFFNAAGRVFTNWVEVDDTFALGGSIVGAVINSILVLQVTLYSKGEKQGEKKEA